VANILPPFTRKSGCPTCDFSTVSGKLSAIFRNSSSVTKASYHIAALRLIGIPLVRHVASREPVTIRHHCHRSRIRPKSLMTSLDVGGVIGVLLVLLAYAGIHFDWFDPKRAPALLMNLFGSALILVSMIHAFNLSAFLMEAAWAAMALYGLLKLVLRRKRI
jgi:hypothetical protein